jgi:hypothetical protein
VTSPKDQSASERRDVLAKQARVLYQSMGNDGRQLHDQVNSFLDGYDAAVKEQRDEMFRLRAQLEKSCAHYLEQRAALTAEVEHMRKQYVKDAETMDALREEIIELRVIMSGRTQCYDPAIEKERDELRAEADRWKRAHKELNDLWLNSPSVKRGFE